MSTFTVSPTNYTVIYNNIVSFSRKTAHLSLLSYIRQCKKREIMFASFPSKLYLTFTPFQLFSTATFVSSTQVHPSLNFLSPHHPHYHSESKATFLQSIRVVGIYIRIFSFLYTFSLMRFPKKKYFSILAAALALLTNPT